MKETMDQWENELSHLRMECGKYNLAGREILDRYTDAELSTIYNGAGPDSWKPIAREILTELMKLFKPEILLHDVQFEESDGTRETFERVTELWKRNCRKIFDSEYPLWTWKILKRSYRLERAYWWGVMQAGNLAISGGAAFSAWQKAYERKEVPRIIQKMSSIGNNEENS